LHSGQCFIYVLVVLSGRRLRQNQSNFLATVACLVCAVPVDYSFVRLTSVICCPYLPFMVPIHLFGMPLPFCGCSSISSAVLPNNCAWLFDLSEQETQLRCAFDEPHTARFRAKTSDSHYANAAVFDHSPTHFVAPSVRHRTPIFTLKDLGNDVVKYDGLFFEWSNTEGAPVVAGRESDTGAKPRLS